MSLLPQCKGYDYQEKKLKIDNSDLCCVSPKYDGLYFQIEKIGDEVNFYSSGGFLHKMREIEKDICKNNPQIDFRIECEYIGETDGKLSSRHLLTGSNLKGNFVIFDILSIGNRDLMSDIFIDRVKNLVNIDFGEYLIFPEFKIMSFGDAIEWGKDLIADGWEGIFIKTLDHLYISGKRTPKAMKFKGKFATATMKVVGINSRNPKTKYSLQLIDEVGREVSVGFRGKGEFEIGDKVEIKYEHIHKTYVQPILIRNYWG